MVRARPAFSLFEVLIAIALIVALAGVMFGFLYDLMNTRARVLTHTQQQRAASLLIDRLERDLHFAIAGHPEHGAGVRGDESSIRVLTRGVAAHLVGQGRANAAFGDLQVSEYRFAPHRIEARRQSPENVSARNGANDTNNDADNEPAADDDQAADAYYPLGERVFRVRFRYHDGSGWRDTFNSADAGRLPAAVEVAVWLQPPPGESWEEDPDEWPAAWDDDEPERLTFDAEGVFDEYEFAMRADRDERAEPVPDRVRVIAVPDAAPPAEEAGGER